MKKAFDIPGINNQKGVLAQYLGIDYDDNSIEERFTNGDIHRYIVNGNTYFVASDRHCLAGNVVHSYNSSLWHILPLDSDQPYMRFTDKKVTKHLESIASKGFSLLGFNQK